MARGLFVLVIIGVIVYVLTRALQSRDRSGGMPWSRGTPWSRGVAGRSGSHPAGTRRPGQRTQATPPRTVAPDDDDDFLRDLDRRRLNPEDPDRPE